ncbi:hypothetical protein OUZ56_003192 [Daphnia magna]|uniref:Uncharacterized protein n=1 Tax=Daphnia magna TaxID=35525 RepID=A0ABR0A809_9CRUS|nr:hypothetical protein OUZ56_003192 [Daphnia magna]
MRLGVHHNETRSKEPDLDLVGNLRQMKGITNIEVSFHLMNKLIMVMLVMQRNFQPLPNHQRGSGDGNLATIAGEYQGLPYPMPSVSGKVPLPRYLPKASRYYRYRGNFEKQDVTVIVTA